MAFVGLYAIPGHAHHAVSDALIEALPHCRVVTFAPLELVTDTEQLRGSFETTLSTMLVVSSQCESAPTVVYFPALIRLVKALG